MDEETICHMSWPLEMISVLGALQCFDTVGLKKGRVFGMYELLCFLLTRLA